MTDSDDEATKLTDLLQGKIVKVLKRHRPGEVMIEFEDGARLFVNKVSDKFEFSVTEGPNKFGEDSDAATLHGDATLGVSPATVEINASAMASVSWSNFVRYVLIAAFALAVGFAINLAIGNGLVEQNFFNPSFYLLVTEYGIFHLFALSITAILAAILPVRLRSILYLSLSVIGFLASIFVFNPRRFGGVHLFIICWGSLVLIALDYTRRVNGRREKDGLSAL